jgi:hypothetical protein
MIDIDSQFSQGQLRAVRKADYSVPSLLKERHPSEWPQTAQYRRKWITELTFAWLGQRLMPRRPTY